MTLKSDVKFQEKMTCGFKYEMKNLMNLTQPLNTLKTSLRWALFVKVYKVLAKKYKGVISNGTMMQKFNKP